MLYNHTITDHFLHPQNIGALNDADGIGEVGSISCGEVVRIFIKINDGVIIKTGFEVFGGAAAIAGASVLTELVKGKTTDEALHLAGSGKLDTALDGLPPSRLKSAVFVCEALQAAIKNYYDNNGIVYDLFEFALGCSMCDGCGDEFV